ncbi:MAG: hypothetical protein PHI52_06435 [Bacteroidales bacterium]|nr:hypothetical protein [Bacteroidales bacterium]
MTIKNTQKLNIAIKYIEKAKDILKEVYTEERKRYYRLASQAKIGSNNDTLLVQIVSISEYSENLKSVTESINNLIETN